MKVIWRTKHKEESCQLHIKTRNS